MFHLVASLDEVMSMSASRADRSNKRRSEKYADLFATYLEERAKAERSGDVADGIAAGRAWAKFVKLFAPLPPSHGATDRYNST